MQTERGRFILSDQNETDIRLFCEIAKEKGSLISLKEILVLTSFNVSEQELEEAWLTSSLRGHYALASGKVVEKSKPISEVLFEEEERFSRARTNIYFARRFAAALSTENPKVLSISGSTSYQSVSRRDDVDFFCITSEGTMWISLTKSLLLARVFRLSLNECPWICLSYVMDENYAASEFTSPQDGLFARDALAAIVLRGADFYEGLLEKCSWMREYFPKLYQLRVRPGQMNTVHLNVKKSTSSVDQIGNLFLYFTVGTYIRLKSYLLNRKLSKSKDRSGPFILRIGKDHCIYESLSYLRLRRMYSQLGARAKSEPA